MTGFRLVSNLLLPWTCGHLKWINPSSIEKPKDINLVISSYPPILESRGSRDGRF